MLLSAKKARIEWLQKGVLVKNDNEQYVLLPFGMRVSRVNLIATAVEKQPIADGSLITLDDGTDTIGARFSSDTLPLAEPVNVGDILVVIGILRETGGERTIFPDILQPVKDPNFELLRELELRAMEKEYWEQKKRLDELRKDLPEEKANREAVRLGMSREFISTLAEYESSCHQQAAVVEEKIVDLRGNIMERINELDSGEGVPYEKVVSLMAGHDPAEVERALGELLNSGEIYEPVAGVYRRL